MFLGYSRLKLAVGTGVAAALSALVISACTGTNATDDASTGASLTVSGGFSGLSLYSLTTEKGVNAAAVTDYTMICSILVDPFTSGSSALASDGSFSVTISGAAGKPIGCMMTKNAAIVAVVQFTSASSSMTGAASGGSALAVNNGATTIQFPTNLSVSNGAIDVPTASVTQNSSEAPAVTWADPTGTWNITGYCQTELTTAGKLETTCNGSMSDDIPSSVYLKQIQATNGSETRTGLSVWKDAAARTACGGKEGVKLDAGWTATGGWDGTFNGGVIDLRDTTKVDTAAAKATIQSYNGQFLCDKTTKVGGGAIVSGTTKCSEVDWTGGGWGMGADACKLYCVMNALQDEDKYDWAGTCGKRYKVRWENNRELATDKNYGQGSPSAGVFAAGTCPYDANFDGCKSGTTVLFEAERAMDQYMIGELFVSGNVGTVMKHEHDQWHFWDQSANGGMGADLQCGGTRVEKMTVTQTSSTAATVSVEHNFIQDSSNGAGCANHEDFKRMIAEKNSMVLKLQK